MKKIKRVIAFGFLFIIVMTTGFFVINQTGTKKFKHQIINETEETAEISNKISQNSDLKLDSFCLAVSGISKEYHFLFLADSHALKVTPETETSQIVEYFTPREQGFVSETGIKSEEMLNKWMEAANSAGVDGVLLGGDIIDSPTDNNLSLLQTALGTLTIPYLYTLGNHDWTFPWAYCNDVAKANYLPKFSAYFRNENPDFQVQDFDGFAIVALNNSSDQFTLEAAESFSNYLKTVGKPVIVMMHVPIHGENIQKTCEASWKLVGLKLQQMIIHKRSLT